VSDERRAIDVFFGFVVLLLSPLMVLVSPFWLAYKAFRTVMGLPIVEERHAQKHHQLLYDSAKSRKIMSIEDFGHAVMAYVPDDLPEGVLDPMIEATFEFYQSENFEIPVPPPVANSLAGARYRDLLARAPDLNQAAQVLGDVFRNYLHSLPKDGDPNDLSFAGTVSDVATPYMIEMMAYTFYKEEIRESQLFDLTRRQLDRNLHEVSKLPYTLENCDSPKLVLPRDYKGENAPHNYLKGTPLLKLFKAEFPFTVPQKARNEHCFIIGGSGHGKTTLLENMLLHDLNDEREPSIVVVDSQGQLINKLGRMLQTLVRNPIIIDPRDNPALNIFDINQKRMTRYGQTQRDQVYNHTLETFSYLFNSLLGANLTVRQTTLFNNLIALMLAMPEALGRNATLRDLIQVMEKNVPAEYMPAVQKLDPIARDFLLKDFTGSRYDQTKEEIRYRIQNILGNRTLSRLFLAPNNTVDFHEELNKGSVILIDTTQAYLGKTNSSYLGRIAITIVLNAILERASAPGNHRPVYLYIDEAQEYFDKGIDSFLTQARKYGAGLTLATQDLSHIPTELRSSIFSNTSIKFAGGVSANDARSLASDMRTDADFLLAQKKLNFACFVRNHTAKAGRIKVEVGVLERELQLGEDDYQSFRQRNRERVAAPELLAAPKVDDRDGDDSEQGADVKNTPPQSPQHKQPYANPASSPPDQDAPASDW
jgi:Type IV secretion-system coupling protein DNA-binding domain